MKKKLALALVMVMGLTMAGCGDRAASGEAKGMVYAVEAGSAGEAAAQEKGYSVNSVASQADALMEVASGTSDAAVIDLFNQEDSFRSTFRLAAIVDCTTPEIIAKSSLHLEP